MRHAILLSSVFFAAGVQGTLAQPAPQTLHEKTAECAYNAIGAIDIPGAFVETRTRDKKITVEKTRKTGVTIAAAFFFHTDSDFVGIRVHHGKAAVRIDARVSANMFADRSEASNPIAFAPAGRDATRTAQAIEYEFVNCMGILPSGGRPASAFFIPRQK
jgi:hypothetical protein